MNSLGVSSDTSSKIERAGVALAGQGGDSLGVDRIRLRIVRPIGIRPSVDPSGFSSSWPRLKEQAHARGRRARRSIP